MKKSLIVFILCLFCLSVRADDFSDIDYNFIQNAFTDIKPVTDKQFNDTVNALTPKPVDNSFKGRLKTFLFGRQYGVQPQPKGQDKEIDIGGETKAIQDIKNGVYYIKLLVSVVGNDGNAIIAGNYKIKEEKADGEEYLAFYQGHEKIGQLKLRKYIDNLKKENDLTYSRVDIVNDDVIRIVYATISDTKCAYARVYEDR